MHKSFQNGLDRHQRVMEEINPPIQNPEDIVHGQILFNRTSDLAKIPTRKYPGDVGFDLHLSRPLTIGPHKVQDAYTDISISLPLGFWAQIVGRSSTLKEHGILVATGILDRGYTGSLHIQCQNLRDIEFNAHIGQRIAQLIILPIFNFEWRETDALPETDRGQRGFGSTGR